jgi:hypothetical protein
LVWKCSIMTLQTVPHTPPPAPKGPSSGACHRTVNFFVTDSLVHRAFSDVMDDQVVVHVLKTMWSTMTLQSVGGGVRPGAVGYEQLVLIESHTLSLYLSIFYTELFPPVSQAHRPQYLWPVSLFPGPTTWRWGKRAPPRLKKNFFRVGSD